MTDTPDYAALLANRERERVHAEIAAEQGMVPAGAVEARLGTSAPIWVGETMKPPSPAPFTLQPPTLVGFSAPPRPVAPPNALLPAGKVRLDGQTYEWITLGDGTGRWALVLDG